jgi:hypothetical protein
VLVLHTTLGIIPLIIFSKVLIDMIIHLTLNRMKVTAIIADDLINGVKMYTQSSTTEAITIALKDWIDMHKLKN